jgi:pyrroline-5-carboxylate reductase
MLLEPPVKTVFIGGGVMAEAMINRAIGQGALTTTDICVAEPISERRGLLAERYAVSISAENRPAIENAELVVLSVKPQHLNGVFDDVGGRLSPRQTVLSIVAGASLASLTSGLDHQQVIRVMPNTPARVGAGMSVWTATPQVSDAAREAAASLLSTMGTQLYVAKEEYLDMATAVSGSGPAYIYLFMEALTDSAVHLGIPRDMARTLVLETVLGSATLAKETGEHPTLLREMVTSPGGTTAEALLVLESGGFRATIMEAVNAAHQKAQALGSE